MANYSKKIPIPGKDSKVIYQTISDNIDHFLSKTPLGNYKLDRDEKTKKISFESSMASGSLNVQDGEVTVDISLSFLATPFKGKLDEGIQKWIAKTFG